MGGLPMSAMPTHSFRLLPPLYTFAGLSAMPSCSPNFCINASTYCGRMDSSTPLILAKRYKCSRAVNVPMSASNCGQYPILWRMFLLLTQNIQSVQ